MVYLCVYLTNLKHFLCSDGTCALLWKIESYSKTNCARNLMGMGVTKLFDIQTCLDSTDSICTVCFEMFFRTIICRVLAKFAHVTQEKCLALDGLTCAERIAR